MSDLIDRQAAIDAIERLYLPQTKGETAAEEINRVAWKCAVNCAEEIIGHMPSAEPQIVRCGECKHYRRNIPCVGGFYDGCEELVDDGNEIEMPPDFFCAYGERRADDEAD